MSSHTPFKEMDFEKIKTRLDLAIELNVPLKKLTYVLYVKKNNNHYRKFEIPKKSGGTREIKAPDSDLKEIQRKLATLLWKHHKKYCEDNNIKLNISHAFEENKSIITNAKIHRNKRYVLNIDLKDFFDSFHFGRVKGFFEKNREFLCNENIATIIAQIACYEGSLPQGAPSSPIITNLICNILDVKLLKIAKEFHMDYTRYADDMTFSTNDKNFLQNYSLFYNNINDVIEKNGFLINNKKTRLVFNDSRQEVTGLIVNDKISIDRRYCKETRAMADSLYKRGAFNILGEEGTMNQLEGRFSFINQIDMYNNIHDLGKMKAVSGFNSREKQYQKFIFYKYFWSNKKPLIVTEGKTDILYLKAALMKNYKKYPNLIVYEDGKYEFKVSFLNRTKRMSYFILRSVDGASAMKNIYNCYVGKNQYPNMVKFFYSKSNIRPTNPVILVFDNENVMKSKPLYDFLNYISFGERETFKSRCRVIENLSLVTNPLVRGKKECEIEDLFDDDVLNVKISGKTFKRDTEKDNSMYFGKAIFANYVYKNYSKINFDKFISMLDDINNVIKEYQNER